MVMYCHQNTKLTTVVAPYIGETGRTHKVRLKEHQRAVKQDKAAMDWGFFVLVQTT